MKYWLLSMSIAAATAVSIWAMYVSDTGATPNTMAMMDLVPATRTAAPSTPEVQNAAGNKHINLSSRQACKDCHADEVKAYERTTHSKVFSEKEDYLACANCHGSNVAEHADESSNVVVRKNSKLSAMELSDMCLKCHDKVGEQGHASLSEHTAAGVNCTSCHSVHPSADHKAKMAEVGLSAMFKAKGSDLCLSCHKNTQAQFAQSTHHRLQEGVMECTTCHNPHGSTNGKTLRADNKQVCLQCHQDKRGPFLFEHTAADNANGCMNCHENHGAGGRNMLKARDPKTLCMSCHSGAEAINMHGVSGAQYVNGALTSLTSVGDCTRCHEEVHGSNTSPFFHR